jgi:hypothetical protein
VQQMKNAVGNLDLICANPIRISLLMELGTQKQQDLYALDSVVVIKCAKPLCEADFLPCHMIVIFES